MITIWDCTHFFNNWIELEFLRLTRHCAPPPTHKQSWFFRFDIQFLQNIAASAPLRGLHPILEILARSATVSIMLQINIGLETMFDYLKFTLQGRDCTVTIEQLINVSNGTCYPWIISHWILKNHYFSPTFAAEWFESFLALSSNDYQIHFYFLQFFCLRNGGKFMWGFNDNLLLLNLHRCHLF